MNTMSQQIGFTPPWWCRNPHQQTIWRKFLGEIPSLPLRRERWETPDQDFLDIDFLDPPTENSDGETSPLVLFLHGFEGSSRAKYILGMLRCFNQREWRGVALNFRSCSGEMNRQPRFYHSGETTDLDWVIRRLQKSWPQSPLFVVGFSLGGNVLLKWLGENEAQARSLVRAAVVVSVPFDLGVAAQNIDSGLGRLYGQNFLSTLKQKILEKATAHPGLIDPKVVHNIKSYIQFEDEVFAPIHDFKDAKNYWRRCSAQHFLSGIRCETLVIHAEDDPFLPGDDLPIKQLYQSKYLHPEISKKGGHAGFIQGNRPWQPRYWAESRALQFLSSFF